MLLALWLFMALPAAAGSDFIEAKTVALHCEKGSLKVARCRSEAADFPIQEVQVCEREDRAYLLQSIINLENGEQSLSAPSESEANRVNPTQVEYLDRTSGTVLLLSADRKTALIQTCVIHAASAPLPGMDSPRGQLAEERECVAKPAVCK